MNKKARLFWKSFAIGGGLLAGFAIVVFFVATAEHAGGWAILGGVFGVTSAVLFAMVDSSEVQSRGPLADTGLLFSHALAIVAAFIAFGLLFNITSR